MIRLTESCARRRGGNSRHGKRFQKLRHGGQLVKPPPPRTEPRLIEQLAVPARAVGGFVEMSHRHVRQDLPSALSVPRVPRADLDDRARFAGPDAAGRHSVHRSGRLHPQHPAARDRRRRPVRGGHGVRHHHPARPRGDGAGGGGRRRDRDLRRPRRPHHPRGDRRDAGARHRSDPAPRRAARAGLHRRRAAAERARVRDRPGRAATSSPSSCRASIPARSSTA